MDKNFNQPSFLIGQTLEELESLAVSLETEEFRGRQLFDWIYSKQVDDYENMFNLPIEFREKLTEIPIHPLKLINKDTSNSKKTNLLNYCLCLHSKHLQN